MFNLKSVSIIFVSMLSLVTSGWAKADSGNDLARNIRSELNMTSSSFKLTGVEYRGSKKCDLEISADPTTGAVAVILNPTFGDHFAFSPAIQDEAKRNWAEVGDLVLVNGTVEPTPLTSFKAPHVLSAVYIERQRGDAYVEANQLTITKLKSDVRVTVTKINSMDGIVGKGSQYKSCEFRLP